MENKEKLEIMLEGSKEEIRKKIPKLLEAIEALSPFFNWENGWYSGESDTDGRPTWNHWSGGLAELKKSMGRDLTDAELTVYSLSLAYGATPLLKNEEVKMLYDKLWPEGNQRGWAIEPEKLKEQLSDF